MDNKWKIAAVGGAAGIVLLGGGVAYAAAPGQSPSPTPTRSADAKPGDAHPGAHKRRPIPRRIVHGTFTVRAKKRFVTVAVQRGKVTAVSGSSVTVTSADKKAQTYTVNGDTRVRLDGKASDRTHIAKGLRAYVITSPKSGTSVARVIRLHQPR